MSLTSTPTDREIQRLASQLQLDMSLLTHEIQWALGEERINRVTPSYEEFRRWGRQRDGLYAFWEFANRKLDTELSQEEIGDIWECVDLTLNARNADAFLSKTT